MLHVICGAPCSGKTTYVTNHSKENDLIIDLDKIASAFGGSDYHASGEPFEVALKARNMAIKHALSGKGEYWLIDTLPTKEHLEQYQKANAEIVVLDTSINKCIERAKDRPKGTEEVIKRWFEQSTYLSSYSGGNKVSDFKVIETQEELDKIIKKRLEQKDREVADTYKDYLSPEAVQSMKDDYEKKIKNANKLVEDAKVKLQTFDETVSKLTKRAEDAEVSNLKTKVAIDNNVPIKLASRLVGTTEEELKADAQLLLEGLGTGSTGGTTPPLHLGGQGGSQANTFDAAMAQFATQLTANMQN
ncbi:MAG: ATP-binding protein [Lachnospiraceae bacterium]|nr:ATP-binding protein [Lachnospiraceae bacterium]